MGLFFYNIFLFSYNIGIRVAAFWNPKAKRWVRGRKVFPEFVNESNEKLVWMHCASLGEFEQGRPLIEAIRGDERFRGIKCKIVVSFFSPSGYEIMKEYPHADHVFYLPLDSPGNARKLVGTLNPSIVLWVKYEFWYYYLRELHDKNIPVYLVSGIFRDSQPFFTWYGKFWRKMLKQFDKLFVQNEESAQLLAKLDCNLPVIISGDTRFDRVIEIAEQIRSIAGISEFCGDSQVIVAGSTWEEDEAEWIHFVKVNRQIKFIIAPHEIDKENLQDVKNSFAGSIFYSEWISQGANYREARSNGNVLIIDNIGMLSGLYRYATVSYVGGGFGDDGVHNVLEAAVYGIPVIHGPEYEKYAEAVDLVDFGGSIVIDSAVSLEKCLNTLLADEGKIRKHGEAAKMYVHQHAGATKKILAQIYENRLLTN